MKQKSRSEIFELVLLMITAIAIAITGIKFHQSFLRILPLFISLVVMLLAAQVNRYTYLLGGFNALLYALAHWYYGLYASMAYAVLVSSPIQLLTFIRWNKKPWGSATVLNRLSGRQRAAITLAFFIAWALIMWILNLLDSNYQLLDSSLTLIGIMVNVLSLLCYIEYAYVNVLTGVLSIILYGMMLRESPEQITYLIFNIYSLICLLISVRKIHRIYTLQQKESS